MRDWKPFRLVLMQYTMTPILMMNWLSMMGVNLIMNNIQSMMMLMKTETLISPLKLFLQFL